MDIVWYDDWGGFRGPLWDSTEPRLWAQDDAVAPLTVPNLGFTGPDALECTAG